MFIFRLQDNQLSVQTRGGLLYQYNSAPVGIPIIFAVAASLLSLLFLFLFLFPFPFPFSFSFSFSFPFFPFLFRFRLFPFHFFFFFLSFILSQNLIWCNPEYIQYANESGTSSSFKQPGFGGQSSGSATNPDTRVNRYETSLPLRLDVESALTYLLGCITGLFSSPFRFLFLSLFLSLFSSLFPL